jgi:hypothetical protein
MTERSASRKTADEAFSRAPTWEGRHFPLILRGGQARQAGGEGWQKVARQCGIAPEWK